MMGIELLKRRSVEEVVPFALIIVCVLFAGLVASEILVLAVFLAALAVYLWRGYDSRMFIGAALFLLMTCAALLAGGKEFQANNVAIWAYYFLVVGVLGLFLEYLKSRPEPAAEHEPTPTTTPMQPQKPEEVSPKEEARDVPAMPRKTQRSRIHPAGRVLGKESIVRAYTEFLELVSNTYSTNAKNRTHAEILSLLRSKATSARVRKAAVTATRIYEKVAYSGAEPSEDEKEAFANSLSTLMSEIGK